AVLPPELVKILMEMGHGDEIVIADGNFPAAATAKRLIRCDGLGVPVILEAVLKLFPLDTYVSEPVTLMSVVPGDPVKPTIWEKYREIVQKEAGPGGPGEGPGPGAAPGPGPGIAFMERFAFYEKAKNAYAVVATGEMALYANVILKKGVVIP
ncbi:MAG TPA: fucose isomerase, partial [Clostridiales bacterium]|nr:fucose isomerase [Clostridiales bacterium]